MFTIWDIELNNNNENKLSDKLYDNISYVFDNYSDLIYNSYKDFISPLIDLKNITPDNLILYHKDEPIYLYSYYIDLNKKKYNIMEKYVYDIAKFHFNRLNLELTDEYTIEYFLNDEFKGNNIFHYDHEEIENVINKDFYIPFLTTITYFDDSIYPTIITNFEKDRQTEENANFIISFPRASKHITFEGGKYLHECCNIFDRKLNISFIKGEKKKRNILNVLFWKKK